MKRTSMRKQTHTRRLRLLTAITATYAAIGSVHAAVNTAATFTTGNALDVGADWSTNAVPSTTNDALFGTAYPNTSSARNVSTSTNLTLGSLDNTNTAYTIYISGNPTSNTSSNSITLGGGGTNGISGANGADLIYAAPNTAMYFLLGGSANNLSWGKTTVVLAQTGNFDVGNGGLIFDNSVISNASGGSYGIVKTGLGILALEQSGDTFTGGVNLSSGTLQLNAGGCLGTAPTSASTDLLFSGSSTLQFYSSNSSANAITAVGATRSFNIASGVVATIDSEQYNAPLNNTIIGAGSLVKIGSGTLYFNGSTSTYTGSTTINAGTIAINASSGLPSTPLILGAGTLLMAPLFKTNQTFASTTLTAGTSSVVSASTFNSSSLSLSLSSLNRSAGSTIDFALPTAGTITITNANANYSGGQQTILAGWATANAQTTWAVSAGTGTAVGAVSALATYDTTLGVSGADVDVLPASNLSTPVSVVNSLRFNTATGVTLTPAPSLTISTGGILQTSAVGSNYNYISNGTLTSNSGELTVIQADTNAFLTINSQITDSTTAVGLTKSGAGNLMLGGANNFSGPTYVAAGQLLLGNNLALQNSTLASGTVIFEGGSDSPVIGGIATSSNISLNDSNGSPVALTFGGNNASTTFNGIFTGSGSLVKVGTGTTFLANANSTFTGGLNISAGTIDFEAGASFGSATGAGVIIGNGAAILYNQAGAVTFGTNRSFTLAGGNETIQIGSVNTATNTSSSAMTIGQVNNASSGSLVGPGSGTATLVKTGLGTLILANNNTYNGGTTVNEGTLVAEAVNSLGVSTLGGGYTGSGPLAITPTQLFATVCFQTSTPSIASLTNYAGGNASAGTANIILGSAIVNGSTGLTIGADNTSTVFSGNIGDQSSNFSGAVGSILKIGTGTLTLSGTDSYTGGTNVSAGGLTLGSTSALPTNTSLTIAQAATVTIANHASSATFVPQAASLLNSGTLDITSNAMVVHNGSIGTIFTEVQSAYNDGTWNGTNSSAGVITSSIASADTTHLTAVGVATGLTSFESQTVVPTDVLLKYTYYGDANLDGHVDGSDYSRIDYGVLNGLTGWYNGDFNYDGVIDGSDYTLIDNAYNAQGANFAAAVATPTAQISGQTSAVPEPSVLAILTLGGIGMLGRRRQS